MPGGMKNSAQLLRTDRNTKIFFVCVITQLLDGNKNQMHTETREKQLKANIIRINIL